MAAHSAPIGRAERAATLLRSFSSPGVAVLAVALPVIFVHGSLQPELTLPIGGDGVSIFLSDIAVLAVLGAALHAGYTLGFEPLRAGRGVFAAAAVLLALIAFATLHPLASTNEYAFVDHAVTAAKYGEYVLLAGAVPLLVRTRADLRAVIAVVLMWAAAAAVVGALQFFGAIPEFRGYRPGEREPSFLGHHDFAALAGAATAVALAWIAIGRVAGLPNVFLALAVVGGAVGVVLSGALAGFVGVAAAAALAALGGRTLGVLTLRRVGAIVALVAVIGAGVFSLRAANIEAFMRFLGIERPLEHETFGGESYVQRLALAYIGLRTFADHPVLGIGWQATSEEWSYTPYLDDTRRKFPKVPERSLPSREHAWGVQNGYIHAAAELGAAGALAFVAALVVPLLVAARAVRAGLGRAADAAVPMLWLVVAMGVWLGLGIVAGIPLDGLQWIAAGLAVASASWTRAAV